MILKEKIHITNIFKLLSVDSQKAIIFIFFWHSICYLLREILYPYGISTLNLTKAK